MTHTITRVEQPQHADIMAIATKLQQFNLQAGPPPAHTVVVLHVLGSNAEPIGGLFGQIAYDWLHIEYLVVPESLRRTGLGTELMLRAEQIARDANCVGSYLDTLAFQARGFYEKLGYVVFGELPDRPRGHSHYFLRKYLTA